MAYVKANELRDPEDNLKVIPDQTMAPIFGTEKIYSIAMMKFLKDHLTKPVQSWLQMMEPTWLIYCLFLIFNKS